MIAIYVSVSICMPSKDDPIESFQYIQLPVFNFKSAVLITIIELMPIELKFNHIVCIDVQKESEKGR